MSAQRLLSLLTAVALLSPLVAIAVPACAPGQHCPMTGMAGDDPPCHGTAIQADDCCLSGARAEPMEVAPVIAAAVAAPGDPVPAPRAEPGTAVSRPQPDSASSTPLYRLFRSLLI